MIKKTTDSVKRFRVSYFYNHLQVPKTGCPFKKLIDAWLASCRADGLSAQTLYDYSDKVSRFYWWWNNLTGYYQTLGAHPKYVSVKEAREFAAYLRESLANRWGAPVIKDLSQATIASYGRTVKVFFFWLEREQHIEQNPFANKSVKFTNRHKKDTLIKSVSTEKLSAIFAALTTPDRLVTFSGKRDLAMISLLLDSGIRRGELLGLDIEDLDMTMLRFIIRDGKSGSRVAYFSDKCKGVLLDYLKLRFEEGRQGPLWLTVDGERLGDYSFGSIIRRLQERSQVKFHVHQLRHTFALMMSDKVSVFSLSALLGHSDVRTTSIYVKLNPDILAKDYRPSSPLTSMGDELPGLQRRGRPRKWK